MNSQQLTLVVSSDPDKDQVFAEVFHKEKQIARIFQEGQIFKIGLLSTTGLGSIPVIELLDVLNRARSSLQAAMGFEIMIASLPDRERVVAELSYRNAQWAEISQETDTLLIQFYPHPRRPYWQFSYDDAIDQLMAAKKKLLCE